jgi:hypothetical protein
VRVSDRQQSLVCSCRILSAKELPPHGGQDPRGCPVHDRPPLLTVHVLHAGRAVCGQPGLPRRGRGLRGARAGRVAVKALSLWQPWASLVALRLKKYETRSWRPPVGRVPLRLAIHAAKAAPHPLERDQSLLERLEQHGYAFEPRHAPLLRLPRGAVIAVVDVVEVERTMIIGERLRAEGNLDELAAGDYGPGRFAWRLENVRRLRIPMPYRGMQGLFEVPDEFLAQHELEPAC